MMDKEFEGGWQAMRDDAERICREIKRRFWNIPPNASYGIHYDDMADILFDMHQVIRYQLWLDNNNPNKTHWTVDAYPASQAGSELLIKIKKI